MKRPPSAARPACGSHKLRLCSNLGFRFVKRWDLLRIRADNHFSHINLPKTPGWGGGHGGIPGKERSMYATCRHVMPSGLSCQSPAIRGSAFCYFHGRRIPPQAKSPSTEHRVEIPTTLDQNGIPHALNSVLQGLADGRISARRASILLLGLQMAHSYSESRSPAPTSLTSDPLLDELLLSADPSDDEAVSLINALAEKLGLDAKTALPRPPGPKRPTQ